MKYINVLRTLSSRLGLIATIIIASNFGCASFPISPAVRTTTNSNPDFTRAVEQTATQENTLQRSHTATLPQTSPFSLQSSNTATIPPANIQPGPLQTDIPTEDIVWEMLGQVNIDRALNDLRQLTGEVPICIDNECYTITNRITESEGLQWAKEYVYNVLVNLGYSVELQDWSRSGRADQNLIARKTGKDSPDEEIYFVAHLDGINLGVAERCPAADDNASGVVGVLELARILSNYTFSNTVVLLIFTGEEQGALGAHSYVDQLSPEELSNIEYVVNVEMLGYDANRDGVMELWSGDHPPSLVFAQLLSEIISAYQLDLAPSIVTGCI